MSKFQRETATRLEDLPHHFTGAGRGVPCEVCTAASDDPRHLAWEQQQIREQALAKSPDFRELGS